MSLLLYRMGAENKTTIELYYNVSRSRSRFSAKNPGLNSSVNSGKGETLNFGTSFTSTASSWAMDENARAMVKKVRVNRFMLQSKRVSICTRPPPVCFYKHVRVWIGHKKTPAHCTEVPIWCMKSLLDESLLTGVLQACSQTSLVDVTDSRSTHFQGDPLFCLSVKKFLRLKVDVKCSFALSVWVWNVVSYLSGLSCYLADLHVSFENWGANICLIFI